jgi:sodium/potassium-transporting ATPase subunit alpha
VLAYFDNRLLTIKGAPDVLIKRCTRFVDRDGTSKILDDAMFANFSRTKDQWSSQGKRIILLARKVVRKPEILSSPKAAQFEREVMEHADSDLTLVGLVGIVDPPRDEIPSVVQTLRGAGIRIFMVGHGVKLNLRKHVC